MFEIVSLSLTETDLTACVYDKQWWIGKVSGVSKKNDGILWEPHTSFKQSVNDKEIPIAYFFV